MAFTSPSETQSGLYCPSSVVRWAPGLGPFASRPFGVGTPLMGLSEIRPSIDMGAWCPLPVVPLLRRAACLRPSGEFCGLARSHLRPGAATSRTRSALAVLHGFDGLLHLALCRFVAPCCRSWGSPCFQSSEASRGPDLSVRQGGGGISVSGRRPVAPEGAAFRRPSADLAVWSARPRGAVLASRRGSLACLLDLSQWRSTLRSFSLASSCAASFELFSRTPDLLPFPGGPGSGVVSGALVDLMARSTAVVAFSPLFAGSSSLASALRKRSVSTWGISPVARPQGFRPLTNPLRSSGVATRRSPDAPLGFAPRRSALAVQ
jgi:hypothetical protein